MTAVAALRAEPATDVAARQSRAEAFHIPSLDGIRAVSFLLVFLGHAGLNKVVPAALGVTVFFFLSGYLITTLLRMEREKTGEVSLKNFYVRRALRILPPFYLIFALAYLAALVGLVGPATEPASMLAVVFHYANYYIVEHNHQGFLSGTGVYWSLAVEEHFYLLFPWLYRLFMRVRADGRTQALLLLALCAVILAWRCVLVFALHASMHRTHVASDARFDSLLFGCVLAVYGNPQLDRSALSERVWKYRLLPLGLVGLILCLAIRNEAFRETVRGSIQGLSLIPVFVCAIRYPEWRPMRFLNLRPVAFMGVLSYSLYLVHLLLLSVVAGLLGSPIGGVRVGVLALGLSVLVAWAIRLTVEKPCARLRRRFSV